MVGSKVRGVLHGDGPPVSQDLFQKQQQIIISRPHNDLLRRTIHPSGGMQIPADGMAQGQISLGISSGKQFTVGIIQYLL